MIFDLSTPIISSNDFYHRLLECRDRARPVSVNQVESFWKKCQDTGIHVGVIVSSSKFCNTANIKAESLGIRCLNLSEVANFDWMLAQGVHIMQRKLLHHSWQFFPEKSDFSGESGFSLSIKEAGEINAQMLLSNALAILKKVVSEPTKAIARDRFCVELKGDNLVMRNTNGDSSPVRLVRLTIDYEVAEEIVPFKLVQYSGNEMATHAAIADLKFVKISGQLMVVGDPQGGKQVVFVPTDE